jgi:hypothetical protein
MLKLSTLAIIASLAASSVAHADFVALTSPTTTPGDTPSPSAPLDISPETPPKPVQTPISPTPKKTIGSMPVASGFGRSVPLAFAVRQIVPPTIRISYEPAAKPDALVDWTGGRKWTLVLREAVRPLGLKVTLRQSTLTIGK